MSRMCEGCEAGEHWRCGMQSWCECECDGEAIDYNFNDDGDPVWPEFDSSEGV